MNRRPHRMLITATVLLAAGVAASPVLAASCDGVNVISPAEKAAGWELLFDGTSTKGWHGYNGQGIQAWKIEDCSLKTVGTEGTTAATSAPTS